MIIYGPQGSGKSLNAEVLRDHFGLQKIWDKEYLPNVPDANTLYLVTADSYGELPISARAFVEGDTGMQVMSMYSALIRIHDCHCCQRRVKQ